MTSSLPIPADPQFAIDRQEPQWCVNCGGEQIFIPCIESEVQSCVQEFLRPSALKRLGELQ